MPGDQDSKTEKATPKKRRDERKKGNVFQSNDVVSVFSLLAIFYTLKFWFSYIYKLLSQFYFKYTDQIATVTELNGTVARNSLIDTIAVMIGTVGPIMFVAMLAGVIGSGAQTRFIFSKESLKPKLSRLNPLQGFRRMFSLRAVVELLKSLIKIILLAYVLYTSFQSMYADFVKTMSMDLMQAVVFLLSTVMDMVLKVSLIFAGVALFDYLYQWFDYEKNMRMSKQDLKEEYKHTEGDPLVKSKIKERQRKMAMSRMMQQVPKADVVIRNPTHFAVALKYDTKKNGAPVVVAKGADHLALRIVAVAEENKVPVTENKPLARLLYSTVEIGREIPPECYTALAEIMAWVYTLKKKQELQA